MIYVNSVTNALYTLISSNATVGNSGIVVDLDQPPNSNPNRTPWVGVYFNHAELTPRRIGSNTPWLVQYDLSVLVQGMAYRDAQTANDEKNKTLSIVMSAINADRTLAGTVKHIMSWEVTPLQRVQNGEEDWFFADEINIIAEVDA